ncbi:hypothetical protein IV454_20240 [Massilia antarctica]|uniref:Uncharacterized protein n=1 Tax=Massilia antarctica TaxID=2765360 RepID=A0AA48WAV9_9BURK|nr:hypothetical protein [Massilia antarctica]QPI47890.1 hypothetical protein IV454_20240 [Massilia antarctica]
MPNPLAAPDRKDPMKKHLLMPLACLATASARAADDALRKRARCARMALSYKEAGHDVPVLFT